MLCDSLFADWQQTIQVAAAAEEEEEEEEGFAFCTSSLKRLRSHLLIILIAHSNEPETLLLLPLLAIQVELL